MKSTQYNIVTGVDGSQSGQQALDWALAEARSREVGCHLVHAWSYGLAEVATAPGRALEQISEDARTVPDEAVTYAHRSGVPVEADLVFGAAANALIKASQVAELLVVGSRGRSGLASALLGSVSSACVDHALCPVVVVPHTARVRGTELQQAAATTS